MEFDWISSNLNGSSSVTLKEVEESFEDPFGIRILPDSPRFSEEARFFNLGKCLDGKPIFSVYRSNGKQLRVIWAREATPEESYFYERKLAEWM